MAANTVDLGSSTLSAFLRAAGLVILGLGAALAFVFAFAAAVIVGAMVAGAALVMRFWPKRRAAAGPEVLEARRTPAGWVVETLGQRKP